MKHQQILDKLAARGHVRALDEDLARWVGRQMLGRPKTRRELERAVIPPILTRWRCLLDADDARPAMKNVVWVALATLLHKYGFRDDTVTANALAAVDELNRHVVLEDSFERQSAAIKELLESAPTPLTRRPRQPKVMTFLRPGDVVSIELQGRFQAAFVHHIHGPNELPVIEFYARRFAQRPTIGQLSGTAAAARQHGPARFGVVGLTYLPDPANQVVTVASQHSEAPGGAAPGRTGPYTLTDIISLQDDIASLFDDRRCGHDSAG